MGLSIYLVIRIDVKTTIENVIKVLKRGEYFDLFKILKIANPKVSLSKYKLYDIFPKN